MSNGTAMAFASPLPDVDIPEVGVFDYPFGDIDEADLDRMAMVNAATGGQTSHRVTIGGIDPFAVARPHNQVLSRSTHPPQHA
jgi:hypothetical protein